MNGYKITIVRVFRIDVWANHLLQAVPSASHSQGHFSKLLSIAGCVGFFPLIQSRDRPAGYGRSRQSYQGVYTAASCLTLVRPVSDGQLSSRPSKGAWSWGI